MELMEMGLSSEFCGLKISSKLPVSECLSSGPLAVGEAVALKEMSAAEKLLLPFEQISGWADAAMEEEDQATAAWAPGASAEKFAFPARASAGDEALQIRAAAFTLERPPSGASAPRASSGVSAPPSTPAAESSDEDEALYNAFAFTKMNPVKKARVVPISGGEPYAAQLIKVAAPAPKAVKHRLQRAAPKVSLCARHSHLTVDDLPKNLKGCACAGILASLAAAAQRRAPNIPRAEGGSVNEVGMRHTHKKLKTEGGALDVRSVFSK
jgi:hypothetical protein